MEHYLVALRKVHKGAGATRLPSDRISLLIFQEGDRYMVLIPHVFCPLKQN